MSPKATPATTESAGFSPRFANAWAALTYALCAFSLAWPALLGRGLLDESSDQFRAGVSFRQFAVDYFRENGSIPLWNPFLQGGMPFVGAMHGDIFYPTFLLRLILPVDAAIQWGMIGHFFLCGMATFWFLRIAARLSFGPALIGGIAYMMTGFVSSLISPGHDGKIFVNGLFPVILIVLCWAIRDGKQWAFGLLAAIVGLTLLTPHPQLFEQAMVAAAIWALFLAFGGTGPEKLKRNVAIKRLGAALLAVGIGTAISAIQYMPAAEYTPWSPRANGRDWDFATSFSFPIEELVNLYLPQFSGILGNYWGQNGIHFHSEYAGVAVLMLAGAAFGATTTVAAKRFVRCWIGIGLLSLLWALGGHTPFFKLIYAVVPMVKYMRAPSTMFFVTAFAIAVFAAVGMQRVLDRKVNPRYLVIWLAGAAMITILAVSGALTNVAHSMVDPQSPYAKLLADRVDAGAGDLKLGALRSLIFVILAAGLFHLVRNGKLKAWQGITAVALLCSADLWTIDRLYWRWGPSAKTIFATDATIDYLKAQKEPGRVLAGQFGSQPAAPNDPYIGGSPTQGWDGLMAHGLRQTFGYHGNEIGRYQIFASPETMFSPTTFAMTNTRFVLTNTDSLPGAKRVAGPVKNSAGTDVALFELPGQYPYAWVAPAIVKYPDEQLATQLRTPNFPVHSIALIDPASATPAANLSVVPAPLNLPVTTKSYRPGKVSLELGAPAPAGSALVVSENYYPGWIATVDGKPVTTERTNFVLIGVPLPTGAKSVELEFTSSAYQKGKLITLLAIAATVLWLAAGFVAERRRTVTAGVAA
jgi:hypothetical protein